MGILTWLVRQVPVEITCTHCGVVANAYDDAQRYCSRECQEAGWAEDRAVRQMRKAARRGRRDRT